MKHDLAIYFAAPLFTHAERLWNAEVARLLRSKGYRVILPQEGAMEMLAGKESFSAHTLFKLAVESLEECNIVLAILDSPDPDSGTAWECGYATKLGRPIVGVRTDLRKGGDDAERPVNLMLAQSCVDFISGSVSTVDCATLVDQIERAIKRIFTSP